MFSALAAPRAARRVARRTLLAAALLAACDRGGAAPVARAPAAPNPAARDSAVALVDDTGRPVRLAGPARRVISLIPSGTETLVALGVAGRVVGRTRYDVAPEVAGAPVVGGGLDPSLEAIVAQRPDVVVAWANDKRAEVPAKLRALGVQVFAIRTEDTTDVFRNLGTLGRLVGRDSAAAALAARLRAELDAVRRSVAGRPVPSAFYVVFDDPPMTAGPNTFIAQLLGVAGARTVFPDLDRNWPTVALEEVVRRQPDVLVVPQGEFRGNQVERFRRRPGWRELRAVREGRVVAVDANVVNRPGPNIGAAARALRDAFHPEAAPRP